MGVPQMSDWGQRQPQKGSVYDPHLGPQGPEHPAHAALGLEKSAKKSRPEQSGRQITLNANTSNTTTWMDERVNLFPGPMAVGSTLSHLLKVLHKNFSMAKQNANQMTSKHCF